MQQNNKHNMNTEIYKLLTIAKTVTNYNQWVYDHIKIHLDEQTTILDIGTGLGNIARYFKNDKHQQVILSDTSDEMLEELKRTFSHCDNYRFLKLDIGDEKNSTINSISEIDTITCINVLEHIENDAVALTNMFTMLRNQGLLLLIVPAIPRIYGTLDRLSGHYRRYRRKELNKKITRAGFIIETQYYMNFLGVITWFLANMVARKKTLFGSACALLDKVVPLLERFEKLWTPPIGQSIVTVCAKAQTKHP